MPFGKHKGKRLSAIPRDYLEWIVKREGISAELQEAIQLHLRQKENSSMTTSPQQRTVVRGKTTRANGTLPGQLQLFTQDNTEAHPAAAGDAPAAKPDTSVRKDEPPAQFQAERPLRIGKSTSRPIKRHGGKRYSADWIISLMPPRVKNPNAPAADDPGWLHYVEPFFGAGWVLFAMEPEGISEVVNDLDGELMNFWDVLKSPEQYLALEHRLRNTPCSQVEFERSLNSHLYVADPVERAASFFVRNRQSRQAVGRDFATIVRNRTRSGMNELPSAWLSAIDGLPEFHARLQRVVIFNMDACEVIRQQDGSRTLHYVDPPYLFETRSSTGEYGEFEMTEDDHRRLLDRLAEIKGRFLLSGYHSPLYDSWAAAHGWRCHEREIDNKASSSKEKEMRTECVWTNIESAVR